MISEKELDELYKEVKEAREMFDAEIAYEYIRKIVKEVLEHFKPRYGKPKVEYITLLMDGKEEKGWEWLEDGIGRKRCVDELNQKEMEYLEKLFRKYCGIEKIKKMEWKLKVK